MDVTKNLSWQRKVRDMFKDGQGIPVIAVVTGATEEEVQEYIDEYLTEAEYPAPGEKAPKVKPPGSAAQAEKAVTKLRGIEKKLRDDEIREKCRKGMSRVELAEEYDLSYTYVSSICKGLPKQQPTRKKKLSPPKIKVRKEKTIAGDEVKVASIPGTEVKDRHFLKKELGGNIEGIHIHDSVLTSEEIVERLSEKYKSKLSPDHDHNFQPRVDIKFKLFGMNVIYLGDICTICGKVINARSK